MPLIYTPKFQTVNIFHPETKLWLLWHSGVLRFCRNQLRRGERRVGQHDRVSAVGRPFAPAGERVPSALQRWLHPHRVVQVLRLRRVWQLTQPKALAHR